MYYPLTNGILCCHHFADEYPSQEWTSSTIQSYYESSNLGITGSILFPNWESETAMKYPLECEFAYSTAILLECAAVDEWIESRCDLAPTSWEVLVRDVDPERGVLEDTATTELETGGVPCCNNCCFCCCISCRMLCLLCLSPCWAIDMVQKAPFTAS